MMTHKKGMVLATCAIIVIGLCLLVFGDWEHQPRYQGRSLSAWLAISYEQGSVSDEEAREAVLHIGTNALPYLLRWIQHQPPRWHYSLQRFLPSRIWENWSFQGFLAGRSGMRAEYGSQGFYILGTNSIAALPELERLMTSNTTPVVVRRALSAVVCIGEPSLPVLERALADTNQIYRYQIPSFLQTMATRDGPAAYLPLMRKAVTNDDQMVRATAAVQLELIEKK